MPVLRQKIRLLSGSHGVHKVRFSFACQSIFGSGHKRGDENQRC